MLWMRNSDKKSTRVEIADNKNEQSLQKRLDGVRTDPVVTNQRQRVSLTDAHDSGTQTAAELYNGVQLKKVQVV